MRPIYYDTETTGVDPEKDRIIEIAAFDPILDKTFISFVNPGMSIPKDATAIHGITDEMVKEASSWKDVGALFQEFCCDDCVLIAHNNDAFDKHFLKKEYLRNGLEFPTWPMIDSLKWARKYRPDLPRHHLQFLRQIYGIAENQAHRALDDVMVLHQVFSIMVDDLPMKTVFELLQSSKPITHMPFGKHQGKPLKEVPANYINWLKEQGTFEKAEHVELKKALEQLGLWIP